MILEEVVHMSFFEKFRSRVTRVIFHVCFLIKESKFQTLFSVMPIRGVNRVIGKYMRAYITKLS